MNADKRRQKVKGRKSQGNFIKLEVSILNNPNFMKLSPRATKLIVDLMSFYNGFNNGDITPAMTMMKPRGWTSNSNLTLALRELSYYGFVLITRQGYKGVCTLIALTMYPIDESHKHRFNGKVPRHDYKVTKKKFNPKWRHED
jgi:hypothetical protein